MTIGELEKLAGITNREAFWQSYAKIKPAATSLDAGVAQLKWLIKNSQHKNAA